MTHHQDAQKMVETAGRVLFSSGKYTSRRVVRNGKLRKCTDHLPSVSPVSLAFDCIVPTAVI